MNRKYIRSVLFGVAIALAGAPVYAQLGGLTDVLGSKSNSKSSISEGEIINKFAAGYKDVLNASVYFLNAFGEKGQAAKQTSAVEKLKGNVTSSTLKNASEVQTESNKILEEKMSVKKVVMNNKSKETYTKGLVSLSKGLVKYKKLAAEVKGYKPGLSSVGSEGNTVLHIVKALPTASENLHDTLKKAVSFAKENNIRIPQDVINQL